jgi:carbon-monoxide dehydrogenase large subunit
VLQGDSDLIPTGGGTGGARSLYAEGVAIINTADKVIDNGKAAAGRVLEASAADIEFTAGQFRIVGTDRRIGILELAKQVREMPAANGKLDAVAQNSPDPSTYPNGCHIAEVEIDPETGAVAVVRYTVVDDMGRVLNPMIVTGQIQGGVAQGIGQALFEHTAYSPDGQLLAGSFMDYCLPHADHLPAIDVTLRGVPCTTNALGVKGAGEAGAVGAAPAIISAVIDALRDLGVDRIDMPATSEKIWRLMRDAKRA